MILGGVWDERWSIGHDLHHCDGVKLIKTLCKPTSFQLHIVKGGETINSIIMDANKDSKVDYDLREAAATAVAESKKMEGGAQGYLIRPGDKIAIPIYR